MKIYGARFEWEYPYKELIDLPIKIAVSQIKACPNIETSPIGLEEISAKFAEQSHQVTGAQKGTLMHLILQKLEFGRDYTKEELKKFINQLYLQKIIQKEEVEKIDVLKIYQFLQSEIYARIKEAKQVEKEKAFCVNLELEEFGRQEVAVQGMIDLYFIDKKGQLVLLDYKTDFIEDEKLLKEKYFTQLNIYKKALEISLNRRVDEVCIYATHLNKLIYL